MRIFLNKCFLKTKQSIRFLPLIKFRISRWSYSTLRTQRSRTWHETNWGSFPHHHQINNTWDKGGCELALYLLVQGVYRLKARKWFASWKQRNGLWAHRECFLIQKNIQKIGPFRRTHQLKPLQYFKLTSWILFCQQNCITHGHAAKCFQRGQLSFNALCTPQTPTPRDFSPDVTDCHFLFFSLFFLAKITYFSQIVSAFMNYCKGQHSPNTHWHLLKTLWLSKNCGNTAIPYQSLASICLASKTSANPLSAKLWTFLKLELIIELWGRINNPHTQHLFIIRRRSYHLFVFLYVIKTTWTDKERESACRRRGLYFDKLLRKDKFPKKLETLAEKQYNQHFISHTVVAELWSVWPRIPNPLECVHAYSCHCVSLQRPCTNWLSIFSQRNVVESRVHKERENALLSFLLNNDEGMGASL